jgi:hypothetical protein
MRGTRLRRYLLAAAVVTVASCSGQRTPATPEEAAARGDELLREVSDTLNDATTFSFTADEWHERVQRNGQKEPYTLKREVIVRRPDRLWSHTTGTASDTRNIKVTYDGKTVTVVGDTQKVYASIPAPPTLDEMLDLISDRYDLRVAVADFLYSSPYDSFAGKDATGGWWVKLTTVGGRSCDEVAYQMPAVDFTLSVTTSDPVLPCEAHITYKKEPGRPKSRIVFSNWNLDVHPPESQFAAQVPPGYELIPVVERIPKSELKADAAKAMHAAPRK